MDYIPEALHPDDFSFDRQVPAVKLTKYDPDRADLRIKELQRLKGYVVVGDEQSEIAHDVVGFLRARRSGDAEDSLHARNDYLFNVRLICMPDHSHGLQYSVFHALACSSFFT